MSVVATVLADLLAVVRQAALMLLGLLPYVAGGAFLGAWLACRPGRLVPSVLRAMPASRLVVASAALATVSPLCTMGTVPVVVGLAASGFPVGAGVAFLTASSLANPQMLVIGFGTIGPALTLAQWASAAALGCLAGFSAEWAARRGRSVLNRRLTRHQAAGCSEAGHEDSHGAIHCHAKRGYWSHFLDQLEHVLLFVGLGTLAAAAVSVLLPQDLALRAVGGAGALQAAAGAAASVPMYVCGGGVLPVLAVLMEHGIAPGTVLAFIIAGPATRLQAIAAVGAFLNRRTLAAYLVLVWLWAVAAGAAFNLLAR